VLALCLAGCRLFPVPADPAASRPGPDAVAAPVIRTVDGDTIVVRLDGRERRVRYIGVNTPESVDPRRPVQCFGKEAAARNHELVAGKSVRLDRDVSDVDQFGRLLRYVFVDDRFVNAELIREGYAQAAPHPPDVKYADLFRDLEREARAAGRGLWKGC
jgi:micrococcal nuclease